MKDGGACAKLRASASFFLGGGRGGGEYNKLVFYAQSTDAVISGRAREKHRNVQLTIVR